MSLPAVRFRSLFGRISLAKSAETAGEKIAWMEGNPCPPSAFVYFPPQADKRVFRCSNRSLLAVPPHSDF